MLARAAALERVLFSQDEDMLRLAAAPLPGHSYAVVYAHQLSAGIGTLVHDLELVLSCCTYDELAGSVTYLPLK